MCNFSGPLKLLETCTIDLLRTDDPEVKQLIDPETCDRAGEKRNICATAVSLARVQALSMTASSARGEMRWRVTGSSCDNGPVKLSEPVYEKVSPPCSDSPDMRPKCTKTLHRYNTKAVVRTSFAMFQTLRRAPRCYVVKDNAPFVHMCDCALSGRFCQQHGCG